MADFASFKYKYKFHIILPEPVDKYTHGKTGVGNVYEVKCQNLDHCDYPQHMGIFKINRIFPDLQILFHSSMFITLYFTEPQKEFDIELLCYGVKFKVEEKWYNRFSATSYGGAIVEIDDQDIIGLG